MKAIPRYDLLLASLTNYYTQVKPRNGDRIEQIISGKSAVSLRLIDWYVTNYCKMHNVVLLNDARGEYFNVYTNYRSQLKAFKKVQFDPFRRRDRILFRYAPDKLLNTTVGQLNFFRWALDNGVLDNIETNIASIEGDMLRHTRDGGAKAARPPESPPTLLVEETKERATKNKPTVDFKSSIKNMTTFNGSTVVSFE